MIKRQDFISDGKQLRLAFFVDRDAFSAVLRRLYSVKFRQLAPIFNMSEFRLSKLERRFFIYVAAN